MSRRPRGLFVGLTTLDLVHRVDRRPGANEKVTATRTDVAAGGPAAVAALTFAALGGHATLVTSLGQHPLASVIRHDLEDHGVTILDVTPDRADLPAVSAISVTSRSGDRSVVGTDAIASSAQLPALDRMWEQTDVLLLDGHHPQMAREAAPRARAYGVPVVVDLGRWKPVMADLLPHTDHMVCSADARMPPAQDSAASAELLRSAGVPVVVVTHGAEPVEFWDGRPESDLPRGTWPVPAVTARDTLGAGDVFHGAYAWAVARNLPMDQTLSLAASAAATRVQHEGPRDWLSHLVVAVDSPAAGT